MTVTPAQNGIFDDVGQRILRLRTSDAALARLPLLCLLLASLFSGLAALASARKLSIDVESVATAEAMLRTWLGEPRQPAPLSTNSAPGYPLLLAILSRLVPGLRDGLACAAERLGPCSLASLIPLLLLQVAAAIATLALAYRLARTLSNQTSVALLTVILMYFATRPGSFAGMVRGQTWLVLLLFLHVVMLSDTIQRGARLPAVTSGCALAGATLFEPLAVVMIPISALLLALTPSARTGGAVPDRPAPLIFLTTAIPALAALISLAVSLSYDGETLGRNIGLGVVQRLAFVGLKASTALATIATSIPLFGDMIATLLPVSEVRLISPGGVEGSLVHDAVAHRWPNALARSGNASWGAIATMLRETLLTSPLGYTLSLAPVWARGLFAGGGVIALLGLFHLRPMLAYARADARRPLHRLVFIPVLAMLAINVLVTGNPFWSNPLLPFVYAYAIAYVAAGW